MRLRPWHVILAHLALIGLSILFMYPFVWMVGTSLKVDERIQTASTSLLPTAPFIARDGKRIRVRPLPIKETTTQPAGAAPAATPATRKTIRTQDVQLYEPGQSKPSNVTVTVDPSEVRDRLYLDTQNYTEAFRQFRFRRYLLNTLMICVIAVIGTVLSCSLVAYGLACVEWRGRELVFWVMLSTMMLPGQVTMIPMFLTYKQLGWINTILPLTVPHFFGSAFFAFLLRQFYRSIPLDLIEAARLDGCSDLGIWFRIMLPLSKPALAVVGLFTFIGSWNDFLGPLIYLMDEEKYTLSIGLAMFQNQYGSDWGQMMAMSTFMTVPIIILFFFAQRTFIQGVKLSGIKG